MHAGQGIKAFFTRLDSSQCVLSCQNGILPVILFCLKNLADTFDGLDSYQDSSRYSNINCHRVHWLLCKNNNFVLNDENRNRCMH